MTKTPEISDGVIKLNGYQITDIKTHLAGDDIENQRWLNDFNVSTEETVDRAIKEWQKDWVEERPRRTFAMREFKSGDLVGGCEVRLKDNGIGQFSYWVFPKHRGRGFGKRGLSLIVDYAFKNLKVIRAETDIDTENEISIKTAESVGFKKEKILRGEWTVAGEKRDAIRLVRLP